VAEQIIRVALYIRVSTDRQAKEGDSLEAQEEALRKYAKEKGYIIVDTYIDGGESGQKLNRTNLTRLLEDVKQNKIDLILFTKLDRWFRSVSDFYKVQSILDKHKVKWKTIWEDYDTTTASGEFWLNMSLALARMEAKRTSERIKNVFDYKYRVQKTVCSGAVPYGYKISEDKKIIIDEEKAQHIRDLYNYYIETNNLLATVRWFQNTIAKKSFSSIKLYLKNKKYIGIYERKKTGEIFYDYIPRILDDETFYKVQEMLEKNIKNYTSKNTEKHCYIFSSLLVCGECGGRFTGNHPHREDRNYYRCKKAIESIYCKNKVTIPETRIEKYLIDNILESIKTKKIEIENISKIEKEKQSILPSLKNKLNKLTELYINDMIDLDYYKKEYNILKSQIDELENKSLLENSPGIDYNKIENFFQNDFETMYYALTSLEKRKLWMSIIDNIEIRGKYDFLINLK